MSMKRNYLNIALIVTAVVALVTLVVFFVKLDNISRSGSDSESGISDGTKSKDASKDSQDKPIIVSADGSEDKDLHEALQPTPTLEPSPTPSPTPEPSPTPTDVPDTVNVGDIDPNKPIVALSYDDGPSSNTKSILETLEKYGAHATFFMVGENIDMHPDWVKMVYESGNEVANHTINHKQLNTLSAEDIRKEVEGNQEKLNKTLGVEKNYLMRPPYGNVNDTVRATVEHPMILWWVDTLDWKSKDPDAVLEEVKKATKDGAIILMHDLYSSTAEATKKVVPWLKEQGYQICSVSEMFAARGVKMENGKTYNSCISAEKYKETKGQ